MEKTHYLSWKNKENYLLVKYEDLMENPKNEFTKMQILLEIC